VIFYKIKKKRVFLFTIICTTFVRRFCEGDHGRHHYRRRRRHYRHRHCYRRRRRRRRRHHHCCLSKFLCRCCRQHRCRHF